MQATRLLTRLIAAGPGSEASLEVIDDVAIEHNDGTMLAEQGKSTLGGNPVSDRAVGLWKTLSNWVDTVVAKQLNPTSTTFVLYVSKKRSGPLINAFSSAKDATEAQAAMLKAQVALWGAAPSYPKRVKVAASLQPYVDNCLGNAAIFCKVIEKLVLVCGDGDQYGELDHEMKRFPYQEDTYSQLRDGLVGWCKRRLEEMISRGEPARLTYEEFKAILHGTGRVLESATLLGGIVAPPDPTEIANEIRVRTYIRQLQLIDADQDTLVEAANAYLKASAVRTTWATRGDVYPDSFDEYTDELVAAWRHKRRGTQIVHADRTEVQQGALLYGECLIYRTHLQGMEVPNYFTLGNYQALADSLRVGWHPGYEANLKQ